MKSELEDEIKIKGKTEELLVKQLKTCEGNMQELIDFIRRPNLRIMGIEEGEEVQAKVIHNIFNKIITENFPNLESYAHSGIGSLQNTKKTTKIEIPHDIQSLKQAQIIEKNTEGCKREKK
jgi:hypothetical protein